MNLLLYSLQDLVQEPHGRTALEFTPTRETVAKCEKPPRADYRGELLLSMGLSKFRGCFDDALQQILLKGAMSGAQQLDLFLGR